MKFTDVPERRDDMYVTPVTLKNGVQSCRLRLGDDKSVVFQSDTVFCTVIDEKAGIRMTCSQQLHDVVEVVDGVVLNHAMKHSEEFFGKKLDDPAIIKMFHPTVDEKSMDMRALTLDTDVFDTFRNLRDSSIIHDDCPCVVMMEVVGVYFAKRRFGLRWNVKQILARPTKRIAGYAFDDEDV